MIKELRMGKANFNNDRTDVTPMASKVKVSLEDGASSRKEWIFTRYFLIGRRESADVCIKNPHVSRLHTAVFYEEGKWWIEDLKSSNGTIVNGKKIQQSRRQQLCRPTQLQLSTLGPKLILSIVSNDPELNPSDLKNLESDDMNKDPAPVPPAEVGTFANFIIRKWWKYVIAVAPVIVVGLSMIGYDYIKNGYMSESGKKDLPVRQSHTGQEVNGADNGKPNSEVTADGIAKNHAKGSRQETVHGPSDDKMLMSFSPGATDKPIDQNYSP